MKGVNGYKMINNDLIITGSRAMARSYAKINLTLDVLGKRPDGYHDIETIMQTLNLYDLILVDKSKCGIRISSNLKYLPNNDKNIAYKAAQAFIEKTGINRGVTIMIHKNIPVAAGLAGGSGNGAAVLVAMNRLFNTGLSDAELCEMGAALGADIPFCISGGTQLSQGIGEILTPLYGLKPMYVLLVKPSINISTAAIYSEIDNTVISKRPDTKAMTEAIKNNDIYGIASNLCNVMESVTEVSNPIIKGIKTKMMNHGAIGTLMSGSGPSVFGIFDDYDKIYDAANGFYAQFKDTFITKTYNK